MPASPYAKLCPGCFANKRGSAVCPQCGYDETTPRGGLVLPHRTMLNNQYLIGCTLGKLGGFGITYLAWDLHLETPVAIKEYLPRELAGRDANQLTVTAHSRDDSALFREGLALFLKEARTLAKFDHENIVRVRNVLEENGTAYLVMNFYEGTTLAAHLEEKGGRLPETIALSIMLPVLDGLRQVHAKGFLHRDIKPQNIYLTTAGTPILLDFGSARMLVDSRTRSMTVLMTPGYAPFEQYHRKGQQGPWTDIYACGATLYQMLTGAVPLEATARAEQDTLPAPAELLPDISPAVSELVMRAMSMQREARPANAAELMDALLKASQTRGTGSHGHHHDGQSHDHTNENAAPETHDATLTPYFKAALGKGPTAYYLKRFANFNDNWVELIKPTWNWAGFIFNAYWLLYKRIFGLGVGLFLLPLALGTLTDDAVNGLGCWIALSLVLGSYGNALYFSTLVRRISAMEEQFPGTRLQPLKLARLSAAGQASFGVPLVYFFIGLVAIYSHGQYRQWVSSKPDAYSRLPPASPISQASREPPATGDETSTDSMTGNLAYDPYQYKEKADILLDHGNWLALLEHSQQWCTLDRLNPDAWLAFGIANFQLAQYALAQPAFETYFRLKPGNNDYVLGYLVKTYLKLKKTDAAEQALQQIIALRSSLKRPTSSDDAFYFNELGNIYFMSTEKPQEALQLYQQALAIEPDNARFKANVEAAVKYLAEPNPLPRNQR